MANEAVRAGPPSADLDAGTMRGEEGGGGASGVFAPFVTRSATRSIRLLVTGLIAALVLLLLASAGASFWARLQVADAQASLDHRWLPAQAQTLTLQSAYVDQETGERGFLLTGETSFLDPYTRGQLAAARAEARLRSLLAIDHTGTKLLQQVVAAHDTWQSQTAVPEIEARRAGPLPQAQLDSLATKGKRLFDVVRSRLELLSDRTGALSSASVASVTSAQRLADGVAAVTVVLALAAAALAFPVTRRVLTRPLDRLLAQLQTVAGGDYGQVIEPGGAKELAMMGEAAERMRRSLIRHSDDLVVAQRSLTLRDERVRLAADLHDRSIQRLFALGLSLSSLAKRYPEAAPRILALVDDTDRGIRELRGIIFNLSHDEETSLRHGVDRIVRESSRVLGFLPDLELRGPLDHVADEEITRDVLAVLREGLSNVVRHARASRVAVVVAADRDRIHLTVADDGVGVSDGPQGQGIRNMQARATRLGGTVALHPRPEGGTTLEWSVPLPT